MSETLAIYGGTFSPPHNGHTELVKAFCKAFDPDLTLIMPVALPPHKNLPRGAGQDHRLNMVRLAFGGMDKVEVSDYEIRQTGVRTYTYDTVMHFGKPGRRIFLLCGTDMIMTFDKWYRFSDLLAMCEPVYAYRSGSDPANEAAIDEKVNGMRKKYGAVIHKLDHEITDLSSFGVREKLYAGEDVSGLIPENVYEYIKANGLYRNE